MLAAGVTFEFPVVLVALELAGVLTPARLSKWRRWAIIGMVVFAAVVTPSSDPFSMLALAIPLLRLLRGVDRHRQGAGQVMVRGRRSS